MEINWNHYYGIVKKITFLTGIWPYLKPVTRMLRVVVLALSTLTIFIPQLTYQFRCNNDFQCVCESIATILSIVACAVKVGTFQFNFRKIEHLVRHTVTDWKRLEAPEEYEIMKSYAENCKRFSLIYPVYMCSALFIYISASLTPQILDIISPLNDSRPIILPHPAYYFVDDKKYFIYIFWHALLGWEVIMIGISAHDCMFVMCVEHVCSMFAIVGFRFEYLFCKRNNTVEDTNTDLDDTYRKRVAFVVQGHQEALELAQLLEDICSTSFGVQLLISTIGMSVSLLQVTHDAGLLETFRYAVYIIGQLIHLFFLSLEGQKIIDHSAQTRDKIYNSQWYDAPMKSQKLLMLVMMKSLRPASISAGKVYVFSLESFTTVLQASMSYFTVLASFQ